MRQADVDEGSRGGLTAARIDGVSISSATALGPAIQSHKPGQQVRISWIDQSGSHTATVNLATGAAA